MLFRRYNDVSFLLSSMRFSDLPEFIKTMYQEKLDDDLRENWLSNPFREKSFEEFKDDLLKEHADSLKTKTEVETEAVSGMNEALKLLNTLGGEGVGS
ncbi:hypothetical protein [Enterococcus sp. 5H]|uniref:hypothetical protein n=1 Tax=Enterococcus sp. 5H TaxID=1229490 RepID=UPI002304B174|nr:hypothetical protein [Enterococcus sp. 5H]